MSVCGVYEGVYMLAWEHMRHTYGGRSQKSVLAVSFHIYLLRQDLAVRSEHTDSASLAVQTTTEMSCSIFLKLGLLDYCPTNCPHTYTTATSPTVPCMYTCIQCTPPALAPTLSYTPPTSGKPLLPTCTLPRVMVFGLVWWPIEFNQVHLCDH